LKALIASLNGLSRLQKWRRSSDLSERVILPGAEGKSRLEQVVYPKDLSRKMVGSNISLSATRVSSSPTDVLTARGTDCAHDAGSDLETKDRSGNQAQRSRGAAILRAPWCNT
jgi:hypothetical protein